MEKREPPKDSRFVEVTRKAAEKRAEMDRRTQAKAVATTCPTCKEGFESPSQRDLHILDKHDGETPKKERDDGHATMETKEEPTESE
jgi:hypothetical protein